MDHVDAESHLASVNGHSVSNEYHELQPPETITRTEVETRKLNAILGHATDVFPDGYEVIPVGNEGFIIRNLTYPVDENGDWVTFDLDDTLINYSASKKARANAYAELLQDRGIDFDESIQTGVISAADRFSRWTEPGSNSVTYHLSAHIQAAEWLTAQLARIPAEHQPDALIQLESHLDQVKAGEGSESDPFHFHDGRLITRHREIYDRGMEAVFMHSIAEGAPFDDTVGAMEQISALDAPPNMAVLTRGTPDFQLTKQIELMRNRKIPVAEIWLTKDMKGDFLHTLAASGHPAFSGPDNAVVHLDDRATDVASILLSRESGTIGSAMVDVVHLWRPDSTESGMIVTEGHEANEPYLTHNAETEGTELLVEKLVAALRDRLWSRLQSTIEPEIRASLLTRFEGYERFLAHS